MRPQPQILRRWCACSVLVLGVSVQVLAQTKPASALTEQQKDTQTTIRPCVRSNGLEMIRQQIAASNLISDTPKRLDVMLRAADMIWVWDAGTARSIFRTAFSVAADDYQSKLRENANDASSLVDLRYKVIAAISKRDVDWGRRLTDQVLKEVADTATNDRSNLTKWDAAAAERLLGVALSVLTSDKGNALVFANISLRYPATTYLPAFLYKLSEFDKPAADQLYQRALNAYAESPMSQFLFLSSYPFGNDRDAGEMSNWIVYTVPANFKGSRNLEQLFLSTLIRRSRQMIQDPSSIGSGGRFSDDDQAFIALTRLKLQIDQFVPELSGDAEEMRAALSAIGSGSQQRPSDNTSAPKKTFSETVAQAERIANPARREQQLALAILHTKEEPLEQVLDAAAKIDDSELRDNLVSWVYFERAQKLIGEDPEEAQKLAAQVREVELRVYLFSKIAEVTIKQTKLDTKARELLEDVVAAAAKAPNTEPKARAFLGVAYLYSKIDANRSIAVLDEAVKTINKIETPNFSSDILERKIKGQTFTSSAILRTPGFNPENAFRDIGKVDFDGTRNQAANLKDKYLASVLTLVLAEQCLRIPDPRTQ